MHVVKKVVGNRTYSLIKGVPQDLRDDLINAGAPWNDKLIAFAVEGATISAAVQAVIDGHNNFMPPPPMLAVEPSAQPEPPVKATATDQAKQQALVDAAAQGLSIGTPMRAVRAATVYIVDDLSGAMLRAGSVLHKDLHVRYQRPVIWLDVVYAVVKLEDDSERIVHIRDLEVIPEAEQKLIPGAMGGTVLSAFSVFADRICELIASRLSDGTVKVRVVIESKLSNFVPVADPIDFTLRFTVNGETGEQAWALPPADVLDADRMIERAQFVAGKYCEYIEKKQAQAQPTESPVVAKSAPVPSGLPPLPKQYHRVLYLLSHAQRIAFEAIWRGDPPNAGLSTLRVLKDMGIVEDMGGRLVISDLGRLAVIDEQLYGQKREDFAPGDRVEYVWWYTNAFPWTRSTEIGTVDHLTPKMISVTWDNPNAPHAANRVAGDLRKLSPVWSPQPGDRVWWKSFDGVSHGKLIEKVEKKGRGIIWRIEPFAPQSPFELGQSYLHPLYDGYGHDGIVYNGDIPDTDWGGTQVIPGAWCRAYSTREIDPRYYEWEDRPHTQPQQSVAAAIILYESMTDREKRLVRKLQSAASDREMVRIRSLVIGKANIQRNYGMSDNTLVEALFSAQYRRNQRVFENILFHVFDVCGWDAALRETFIGMTLRYAVLRQQSSALAMSDDPKWFTIARQIDREAADLIRQASLALVQSWARKPFDVIVGYLPGTSLVEMANPKPPYKPGDILRFESAYGDGEVIEYRRESITLGTVSRWSSRVLGTEEWNPVVTHGDHIQQQEFCRLLDKGVSPDSGLRAHLDTRDLAFTDHAMTPGLDELPITPDVSDADNYVISDDLAERLHELIEKPVEPPTESLEEYVHRVNEAARRLDADWKANGARIMSAGVTQETADAALRQITKPDTDAFVQLASGGTLKSVDDLAFPNSPTGEYWWIDMDESIFRDDEPTGAHFAMMCGPFSSQMEAIEARLTLSMALKDVTERTIEAGMTVQLLPSTTLFLVDGIGRKLQSGLWQLHGRVLPLTSNTVPATAKVLNKSVRIIDGPVLIDPPEDAPSTTDAVSRVEHVATDLMNTLVALRTSVINANVYQNPIAPFKPGDVLRYTVKRGMPPREMLWEYRRDAGTVKKCGRWSYRPFGTEKWTEVLLHDIRRVLDAGEVPYTGSEGIFMREREAAAATESIAPASEPSPAATIDEAVATTPMATEQDIEVICLHPDDTSKTVPVSVKANVIGQLAVHRTVNAGDLRNAQSITRFTVTHLASLRTIVNAAPSIESALALAMQLQVIDFDAWQQSGFKSDARFNQVKHLVTAWGEQWQVGTLNFRIAIPGSAREQKAG